MKPHRYRFYFLAALARNVFLFAALLFLCSSENTTRKLSVKILTYNIHHAEPPSRGGTIDLDAIAKVINDLKPDVVALQEVDVFTKRSGPVNQAVVLANKTGLSAHFFKTINYEGGEYGVAILSRFPVTETNRYPLPRKEGNGGEPRVLGTAIIQVSARERFLFACTHLDARRDSINRLLQIKAITGLLRDSPLPVVIAGDFNAPTGSDVIGILDEHFSRTCNPCDPTIPSDDPQRVIDFIAFSPSQTFRVKKHLVFNEPYASDHLPVFAELEVSF